MTACALVTSNWRDIVLYARESSCQFPIVFGFFYEELPKSAYVPDYVVQICYYELNKNVWCFLTVRINTFSNCFPSLPSLRQTFGWKSLVINLLLYLFFVIPLTILAIYSRANERQLCGVNETIPRKVTS